MKVGDTVMHMPTGSLRRVSGLFLGVAHFAQVIKDSGQTYYWASAQDCRMWVSA